MDDFKNIKELWNSQNNLLTPNINQIEKIIKDYQIKKKRNVFLVTALFIACGIGFLMIIFLYKSSYWTTIVGEVLISLGFLLGLILKLKSLKKINNNEMKSNKDYLEDLTKVFNRKKPKTNLLQIISVSLLSIGYGFFIYEEIKTNQNELILSFIGILIFSLGMYYFFRPFINRKSKKKIEKLLDAIHQLK